MHSSPSAASLRPTQYLTKTRLLDNNLQAKLAICLLILMLLIIIIYFTSIHLGAKSFATFKIKFVILNVVTTHYLKSYLTESDFKIYVLFYTTFSFIYTSLKLVSKHTDFVFHVFYKEIIINGLQNCGNSDFKAAKLVRTKHACNE